MHKEDEERGMLAEKREEYQKEKASIERGIKPKTIIFMAMILLIAVMALMFEFTLRFTDDNTEDCWKEFK